ncbi:hypothetical protein [Mycolicibacterium bacteremicum]|nr:hypothetical protein [Mycolicibacterium bacteremicum]MCV7434842.1 hypothetical protein [Mycolicibacterium bacteremicum]
MSVTEFYGNRTWADTEGDISPHQNGLATSLRIPILTSAFPRWNYITGIVVCDGVVDQCVMPTDDEIRLLRDHLDLYNRYYRQAFLDAMRDFAPYDIDGGANLGYYMKRPDSGWCYRKRTWQLGARWWPSPIHWQTNGGRGFQPPLPLSHVLTRNFRGWGRLCT